MAQIISGLPLTLSRRTSRARQLLLLCIPYEGHRAWGVGFVAGDLGNHGRSQKGARTRRPSNMSSDAVGDTAAEYFCGCM